MKGCKRERREEKEVTIGTREPLKPHRSAKQFQYLLAVQFVVGDHFVVIIRWEMIPTLRPPTVLPSNSFFITILTLRFALTPRGSSYRRESVGGYLRDRRLLCRGAYLNSGRHLFRDIYYAGGHSHRLRLSLL
jgi:hypothetical protein